MKGQGVESLTDHRPIAGPGGAGESLATFHRRGVAFLSELGYPGRRIAAVSIVARGLVKTFSGRPVVNGVDLQVHRGQVTGLLGPNGAGKTTTFYMIVGLERCDAGTIELDGQDITSLPMYRRARLGIGYLAQEASVFRKLTVEENLLAVLEVMGLSPAQRRERLEELLEEFQITGVRKRYGYMLSGGERRSGSGAGGPVARRTAGFPGPDHP